MARRHAASLLPKWHHDPALLKLVKSPLTNTIVGHIADKASQVIRCRDSPAPSHLPSPPSSPNSDNLPPLDEFITNVVKKSKCHVPTLLCTLVYLDRLRYRLPAKSHGSPSTRHRVFLSALIVAAKYLNDSSPQNRHWVRYALHFTLDEVNLMERQLLALLDFDCRIDESELLDHFAPFLHPSEAPSSSYCTPRSESRPILSPISDDHPERLESRPKTSHGRSRSTTNTGEINSRLLTPAYTPRTPKSTSPPSPPPPRPARSPERNKSRHMSWSSVDSSNSTSSTENKKDDANRLSHLSTASSSSLSSEASSAGPLTPIMDCEDSAPFVVSHGQGHDDDAMDSGDEGLLEGTRRKGMDLGDKDRLNLGLRGRRGSKREGMIFA